MTAEIKTEQQFRHELEQESAWRDLGAKARKTFIKFGAPAVALIAFGGIVTDQVMGPRHEQAGIEKGIDIGIDKGQRKTADLVITSVLQVEKCGMIQRFVDEDPTVYPEFDLGSCLRAIELSMAQTEGN